MFRTREFICLIKVAKRNKISHVRLFSNFSSQFYKVADEAVNHNNKANVLKGSIKGEIIDHAVDLKNIRPGETIDVPYELTISNSLRDFWQSAFYCNDRIHTSTPFARTLGFQGEVMPFGLMLFLASSMSHADYAKLENGYCNGRYLWPVFSGDTLKKKFIIMNLRPTSDGKHSIFRIHCELTNQRGVTVFTCEKTMLFPFQVVKPSDIDIKKIPAQQSNSFLATLVQSSDVLEKLGSQTLTSLRPGQLIIHTLARSLSETHSMQLASLARLTHERHFNTRMFRNDEILIPGGLVFGLTCSLASRDLHEVLYEELKECSYPNQTNPRDTVCALTYVEKLEEHVGGDIEAIHIRSIGAGNSIVRPAALEEVLKKGCPELSHLIVCIADRVIYRQTPKHTPFLL